MTTSTGRQFLADISGDAAEVWQAFAKDNNISLDSLLDALGPILISDGPSDQSFASALTQAVAQARSIEICLS